MELGATTIFSVLYIKKIGTNPVMTHVAAKSEADVEAELLKRGPVYRILEVNSR